MAVNYNDGKWHRWNGECMKPASIHEKSIVQYVWHDESMGVSGVSERQSGFDDAETAPAWSNILKFRVIKEHRKPREFWINLNSGMATKDPIHHKEMYVHVREVIE